MSNVAPLFERIGGQPAIEALVDDFYPRVLGDPLLAPFFAGVNMVSLRAHQARFLAYAVGDGRAYSGRGLSQAHAGLVARGLNDSHFDAVAGHLAASLCVLGVPEREAAEVMAIAGSVRDAVLGRLSAAA